MGTGVLVTTEPRSTSTLVGITRAYPRSRSAGSGGDCSSVQAHGTARRRRVSGTDRIIDAAMLGLDALEIRFEIAWPLQADTDASILRRYAAVKLRASASQRRIENRHRSTIGPPAPAELFRKGSHARLQETLRSHRTQGAGAGRRVRNRQGVGRSAGRARRRG